MILQSQYHRAPSLADIKTACQAINVQGRTVYVHSDLSTEFQKYSWHFAGKSKEHLYTNITVKGHTFAISAERFIHDLMPSKIIKLSPRFDRKDHVYHRLAWMVIVPPKYEWDVNNLERQLRRAYHSRYKGVIVERTTGHQGFPNRVLAVLDDNIIKEVPLVGQEAGFRQIKRIVRMQKDFFNSMKMHEKQLAVEYDKALIDRDGAKADTNFISSLLRFA